MAKADRINVRLEPALRERLRRICKLTGLDEPTALRACVEAFVDYIETHGEIRLPLAIIPRKESKAAAPARTGSTATAGRGGVSGAEDGPRFSVNEEPPADRLAKKVSGPRPRSTRGIRKVIEREKGKS
jgi:hypothetical protein